MGLLFATAGLEGMPKLIVVAGPSGVGKSPLVRSIRKLYPKLGKQLHKLVLYNDRKPRPGEHDGIDYHFRSSGEIKELKDQPGYVVVDNRGDLQALELNSIKATLDLGHNALYEGNVSLVMQLRERGVLQKFDSLTIFLSPLSRAEFLYAKEKGLDLQRLIADIQRRKLLQRAECLTESLSPTVLADIEKRAKSAYGEVCEASSFDYVVPLYDGEGHDNWDRFGILIGSARSAVNTVAQLVLGKEPDGVEHWEKDLIA